MLRDHLWRDEVRLVAVQEMKHPCCDGFAKKPGKKGPGQIPSPAVIESTIQSGDSLMSVVPSIIVPMITALIVFRREITRCPTPGAKQRHWHRTMPLPLPKVPQPSGTPHAHTQLRGR